MGMKDGGFQSWVSTIPLITRYWFVASFFFSLLVNFRYMPYSDITWNWHKIVHNFEFWRFITPFLYAGPFYKYTMLITLYNLLTFSRLHEMSPINMGGGAGTSDYVFTLMFGAFGIILTFPWFSGPVFTRNLTMFVAYTWSKHHIQSKVSVMFIGQVPALVFPFAYAVIELLSGAAYLDLIHGIVIGHCHYFLTDWVPTYGMDILHTPLFLIRAFGVGEYKASGKNMNFKAKLTKKKARHDWGGNGQRLGTSAPSRSSSGCTQSKLLSMPTPVDEDENFDYAPSPTEEQRDEEEEERESKVLLQSFSEESASAVQDEVRLLMKEKDMEESVLRRRIRMMDAMSDEIKATRYD